MLIVFFNRFIVLVGFNRKDHHLFNNHLVPWPGIDDLSRGGLIFYTSVSISDLLYFSIS